MPASARRTLLSVTLAAVLAFAGPAAARSADEVTKSGQLRVATEGQYAPFNYFQGSKLAGFEVDIAEAVAARMGLKVAWKAIAFDALLTGLQQDRWDLVIASHGITPERAKAVTFADPHYCSGGVVVAKNPAIRSARDLAGKVVAVQTGTTFLDSVKQIAGVKAVKNFPQDNNARTALQTGRADAWVTDRFVAKAAIDADPKAGLAMGEFLFVERIASAVALGNTTLVAQVNKALAALVADGSYARISAKWFKEDVRCQ